MAEGKSFQSARPHSVGPQYAGQEWLRHYLRDERKRNTESHSGGHHIHVVHKEHHGQVPRDGRGRLCGEAGFLYRVRALRGKIPPAYRRERTSEVVIRHSLRRQQDTVIPTPDQVRGKTSEGTSPVRL